MLQLNPPPDYIQSRIVMYDRLKAEYDKMIAGESGHRKSCAIGTHSSLRK